MKYPHLRVMATVVALLIGVGSSAFAQGAPTSGIAPGTGLPSSAIGGIGQGNVPLAPGASVGADTDIELIAPGGSLIAPGPAGSVSGSMPLSSPAIPTVPSIGGMR